MENNKKLIIAGGVVIAVVLIVLIVKSTTNKVQPNTVALPNSTAGVINDKNTTSTLPPSNSTETVTATKTVAPKTTVAPPAPLSYPDLVKLYKGFRFQFSNNCTEAIPNTLVVNNGNKYVIDNRENKAHTFTINKQKYVVSAFNYVIITAQTVGKHVIYCDGIQRASVTIEN